MTCRRVPSVAWAGGTKPRAMPAFSDGEKPPEVTAPMTAPARRALGEFAGDARRAGEVAALAAGLVDGEGEVGLDGADGLVQVVAVERQAGLQAQGIACAQADGLHPRVGEEGRPDAFGVG